MNNPQYLPQQSQMYGPPGAGYGAPSAGYPQQSASPRPPPTGAPAGFTSRGPQSVQPSGVYPPMGHQNGPAPPQGFPVGPDTHVRNVHTASPGPNPNLLANQLAGMNVSGSPRPGSQTMGYPGGPPTKPGFTTPPPPGSAQNMYPPGSFPPAMNGAVPQSNPSLDHQRQLSSPFMNGSMPPTGPGRGPQGMGGPPMQQKLSPMVPPQGGPGSPMPPPGAQRLPHPEGQIISPPGASQPQRQMPPQPGGPPPHPMGMPSQPGGPPSMQSGMPPQPGGPPSMQGGMPPQPGGPPSMQGGMPPQPGGPPSMQGGMPPQPGGPPSMQGGMPPQPGGPPSIQGGMPPQPGGAPPMQGGMPPQPGGAPPMQGGMPPQPGGPPLMQGGMPPQQTGLSPQPGGPPSHFSPREPPQMPPGMRPHGQLPPNVGPTPPSTGYMSGQQGHLGPPPTHIQQQQGPPHMPLHQGQMGGPPLHGSPMQPRPGGPVPPGQGVMPSMGGVQQGSMPQYPSGPHMPPPAKGYPPSPQDPYSQGGAGAATHMANAGYQHNAQPQVGGVYSPQQQQQQARRLDPDQMPSPIQVMLDDQHNRSGVFCTNQKGLVPPLVTTNFVTQDQGNASPRFIRSSMYNVPVTVDMMKQTAVPFGLVISPLAKPAEEEYLPPIVDMGDIGPVRCVRCKAYMSPFMQFIDGGRRFHCLLCKATTEVPAEYFQHLDHTGQRVDRYERPELMLGAYEFVATKDYCKNNTFPKPPAMIFVIDVSYNNVKSGMVQLLCQEMKEILKHLPKEQGAERSNMKVGFITYNNTVHFYNVKGSLAQPQMMVVGDVQDMFMPLLDGFLCDPVESEAVIDSLMEQIPAMFGDTRETETVLAPAIQAGLEALKASECAGKLLVFHSSLPIAEAPGKLKNRDDRKLLGTEKEKTVLAPQTTYYNGLGQDCVGVGCSVDLFIFNNSYIDLATIGQVSRLTGGEIFKYTYFQADLDGERLVSDIKRNISRPIAFDAIMRVRTSTGVRATDFSGHFFMSNTMDMELASMDCDKAVAVEIKHDDKLTEEDGVYIQVALLYTSCGGQRRLRILNLSLKTCSQLADLYRSCDLDTIINFFAKQSITRLLDSSPKPVKEGLINRCAQMLACYRKNCASPSSAGQLILPECMKLLLLYVNCILKSDAISGGSDMNIDDRSFVMQAVSIMDIPSSVVYFYPRLLPLHEIDLDTDILPSPIRCSSDKISEDGVYLLENGIHMFLWIGLNVSMEWVQDVFGVHSTAQIDIDRTSLLEIDNPLSLRIRSLIETVREQRHRSMRLTLVRQRDKLETVFKHFLVEDRGMDGSASYVDFLCHMHREIRNLLS